MPFRGPGIPAPARPGCLATSRPRRWPRCTCRMQDMCPRRSTTGSLRAADDIESASPRHGTRMYAPCVLGASPQRPQRHSYSCRCIESGGAAAASLWRPMIGIGENRHRGDRYRWSALQDSEQLADREWLRQEVVSTYLYRFHGSAGIRLRYAGGNVIHSVPHEHVHVALAPQHRRKRGLALTLEAQIHARLPHGQPTHDDATHPPGQSRRMDVQGALERVRL